MSLSLPIGHTIRTCGYKTIFMLISAELEILNVHKTLNENSKKGHGAIKADFGPILEINSVVIKI